MFSLNGRGFALDMSLLVLLLIAFLFPLFGYLLVLGLVNRLPSPLMVPGTWDFAGVLFSVSGFILAGSGYFIYRMGDLCRSFGFEPVFVWIFAILYLLLVVLVALFVLTQRRSYTLIYNVDPNVFERVLGHVLDEGGFQWTRTGNQLVIQASASQPALEYAAEATLTEPAIPQKVASTRLTAPGLASLALSPSRLGRCVALRWESFSDRSEQAIRQEIERGLDRELDGVFTEKNPLGSWFISLAIFLFSVVLTLVVLLVLIRLKEG
jgi:hypothetical protein